ncbi:hypothetical protein GGF31_007027 [Allomyces arbusculus]|nr:hypothetical protein GGF31_007027 [Allomyces arbusculus]
MSSRSESTFLFPPKVPTLQFEPHKYQPPLSFAIPHLASAATAHVDRFRAAAYNVLETLCEFLHGYKDECSVLQCALASPAFHAPAICIVNRIADYYNSSLYNNGLLVQNRGFITARQSRLVAFPNLYQRQVAPFELADPTRPGHRKIIAFFLIDPISPLGQEVVTTTQIPPLQAEWIADAWAQDLTFLLTEKLPREVLDMIVERMEGSMTRKEAMALRLKLMDKRTDFVEDNDVMWIGEDEWPKKSNEICPGTHVATDFAFVNLDGFDDDELLELEELESPSCLLVLPPRTFPSFQATEASN